MCVRYFRHKGDVYDILEKVTFRKGQKPEHEIVDIIYHNEAFPGDTGPIAFLDGDVLKLALATWGLTPAWAKGEKYANFGKKNAYNARAETLLEKPTFRGAFRHHRCLVPASGFYERADGRWLRLVPKDGPFAIAGLYEPPNDASGGELTYTMVTTTPNETIADVHDRMPVVLEERDYADWLDPERSPEDLRGHLVPCPPDWFTVEDAGPVGKPKKDETTGSLF